MSREFNVQACRENREIVRENSYLREGRMVHFAHSLKDHQSVVLLAPENIRSIVDDDDEFFERAFWGSRRCRFDVIRADSFAVQTDLVMNFANAVHPGGGYMHGAAAQEEALCRQSTLYASIGSKAAREMYDHNDKLRAPFDSDYILLSPCVEVFRKADLSLMERPYTTAVMTIPAPNLYGRACGAAPDAVRVVMLQRIRQYLYCAARYGYRNITLGAWGCGAFGHDAKDVAGYFRMVLIDEGMWEFFDSVTFAILDNPKNPYNYEAFAAAFRDISVIGASDEEEPEIVDEEDGVAAYYLAEKPFPVCNHTQKVDSANKGFCQGILVDGCPFEAEIWESGNVRLMGIILPQLELPERDPEEDKTSDSAEHGNVIGFHNGADYPEESVLWFGMVDHGQEEELKVIRYYIDYLKEAGLVSFPGDMENGAIFYCTDIAGNDLAKVNITLEENGEVLAETPLTFRPFWPERTGGKVIRIK